MPIIKSRGYIENGLHSIDAKGDNLIYTHVEDVMPYQEYAYLQRKGIGNGFSKKRHFRKIASIPPLVWMELVKKCGGNPPEKEIRKFLKTEEGKMFKTVDGGI